VKKDLIEIKWVILIVINLIISGLLITQVCILQVRQTYVLYEISKIRDQFIPAEQIKKDILDTIQKDKDE